MTKGRMILSCVIFWLAVPSHARQFPYNMPCLQTEKTERVWSEFFFDEFHPREKEWQVVSGDDWYSHMGELDGGNSDLVQERALIVLPEEATENISDYLLTLRVWNTQREGMFFVAFRYRDPENYYAFEYRTKRRKIFMTLVRVEDGETVVLDSQDSSKSEVVLPDITYGSGPHNAARISIAVIDAEMCVSTGPVALTARDSTFTHGRIALGHQNYHPMFDRIEIYTMTEPKLAIPDSPQWFTMVVPSRDEGLALLQDFGEAGIENVELLEQEDDLRLLIGPVARQEEQEKTVGMMKNFNLSYQQFSQKPK